MAEVVDKKPEENPRISGQDETLNFIPKIGGEGYLWALKLLVPRITWLVAHPSRLEKVQRSSSVRPL